ncbi:MAG: autotransporter domain-containing protein [Hyphomicrobiales bacterium]
MTNLRKLLLAGCALTVSTTLAQAQFATSGDVISFGDSLSDNGNLFAISGAANDFPGSSRFVNPGGLTWIEQLLGGTPDPTGANAVSPQNSPVQGTGVTGDVNVAFGGAFAGSGGLAAGIPGVTEQQGIFAGAGGTIDADDTVTYWAGANNFFAGLPLVTDAAGAAALGQNVGALAVNDITQLATGAVAPGGGPGQLVYLNLPNLASLPSTNLGAEQAAAGAAAQVAAAGGDAAAQAVASAQTQAAVLGAAEFATQNYNTTLEAGVAQLAAVDTNTDFVLIDVAAVFDEVTANPEAFGFTNVTAGCVFDAACAAADFETQNEFLFSDGVHPTNAGHALIAELARQTIDPTVGGSNAAAIADLSSTTRQIVAGSALSRARSFFFSQGASSDVSSSADVDTFSEKTPIRGEAFAEVLGGTASIGARTGTPRSDIDLIGVRLGADILRSENLVVGVQGSFVQGDGSQPALSFESNSLALDVYLAGKIGNVFAALTVGGAYSELEDITRSVGVGPLTNLGESDAKQFSAIGELGYDYKFGGLSVLPSVTLGYFNTTIDDYTEVGVFAPLAFGERSIDAVTGAVNIRAAKTFSNNEGVSGVLYAGVGYEDYLSYDADDLSVGALASTAAASSLAIDDPEGRGFLFDVGTKVKINNKFSIGAEYRLGVGGDNTRSHQGSLRVSTRF